MTIEEITQTLQTVAENQAKHDEMRSRHSADIAEIDRMLEASLRSQNRYDERLAAISEIMHTLADKQLKNEELFAEFAAARERHEVRMGQLEATYELFEGFVRDFRNETHDHFAETDKRLAALISSQAKTDEQMKRTGERVDTLTSDIAAVNGRVDHIGEHLDQVAALQSENAAAIKTLIAAQARTDEQIGKLLDRNGSTAVRRAKVKKAPKKTGKKGSAK